jgi:hypothetical protein
MKKNIRVKPIKQNGHTCKPTAIAMVESFYAPLLGLPPLPLRKQKAARVSIRQLAKRHGSVQGELLETEQVQKIFEDLGYCSHWVDFQGDYFCFKSTIISELMNNNLILGFMAVNRSTGMPSPSYDDNEHAVVIHGFDEANDTLVMTHWGRERVASFYDFYYSAHCLPTQREAEYYYSIKNQDPIRKYEKAEHVGVLAPSPVKKSITPHPNTGFYAKFLVIQMPQCETLIQARRKLAAVSGNVRTLKNLEALENKQRFWILEVLSSPIQELALREAIGAISDLRSSIKTELSNLNNQLINADEFAQRCLFAIETARPVLEQHRGLKKILANLTLFVLGVGVGYFIAGLVHLKLSEGKHFLFFSNTDSGDLLNELELEVKAIHQGFPLPIQ